MKTWQEIADERQQDKVEARRRLFLRLHHGDLTVEQLENHYRAQNYNNIMLFDTLSVVANELFNDYVEGAPYIPTLKNTKNYMYKMERCRQSYEAFRRTMYRSDGRIFEKITDLYYEAVMRPMQMLEINVKQLLDKERFQYSRYLAKLETLRLLTTFGVGISWAIEDISYVAKNPTGKAGYIGGPYCQIDSRANMRGIQHWIVELEREAGIMPKEASEGVENSFEQIENAIISGDLCLECAIIIADELKWEGLPAWFPLRQQPTEEHRAQMKYKTREDIEK